MTYYCNEIEFTPISTRNVSDYIILKRDDNFLYVLHPQHTIGFVFTTEEVEKNKQTIIPALRLSIEDNQVRLCKIQNAYRETDLLTTWLELYTNKIK